MRYAYSLLASLLICSPAYASPVTFAIDLLFPPLVGPDGNFDFLEAVGPQPNAGSLSFDDRLLTGLDSFVPLPQLMSFDLSIRVSRLTLDPGTGQSVETGEFLTVTTSLNGPGRINRDFCVLALECGLRFSGNSFVRFEGFFTTDPRLFPTVAFSNAGILARSEFDEIARGQFSLRPVPEPSSWAVIGVCGLLVGLAMRRRLVSAQRTALES